MLHRAELGQEFPARRVAAEGVDHPGRHVVDRDVGGGRGAALRQFLEDQRGVEPRERRAADVVLDIDAAEAERRRLRAASRPGKSRSRPSRARAAPSPRARSARAVAWKARCSSVREKSMASTDRRRPCPVNGRSSAAKRLGSGRPPDRLKRPPGDPHGDQIRPSFAAEDRLRAARPAGERGAERAARPYPCACAATAAANGRAGWCGKMR